MSNSFMALSVLDTVTSASDAKEKTVMMMHNTQDFVPTIHRQSLKWISTHVYFQKQLPNVKFCKVNCSHACIYVLSVLNLSSSHKEISFDIVYLVINAHITPLHQYFNSTPQEGPQQKKKKLVIQNYVIQCYSFWIKEVSFYQHFKIYITYIVSVSTADTFKTTVHVYPNANYRQLFE
jgi:hypothetical protein